MFQENAEYTETLWKYYAAEMQKNQRPKLGLQQYRVRDTPNRLLRHSGIYRNPALTRGQKLYLLEKCHVSQFERETQKTRLPFSHFHSFRFTMLKIRKIDI